MNKSTGLKWLGTIPSSWNVCRVKDIFEISKEKSKEKNPVILSLARDSIKVRDISTNAGQLAASYEGYNPVKKGDLLLNPMDLYSGANCNVSNVEGVISPAYSKLRAKAKINPLFYDYYFKVQYWTMAMFAHGKGVSFDNRWTLSNDVLRAYELPLPSFETQNKIVEVIHSKEQKINALIANEEQQIQKLQQYKQAVISETVTKGLSKKMPMKNSGNDSIGIICSDFKLSRIKYVSSCNDEVLNEKTLSSMKINYVDISSVDFYKGITSIQEIPFSEAPSRARRLARKNDVVVSTVRTYLKAIALVTQDDLVFSTGFAVLRPKKAIYPSFLSYFCKSDYFINYISKESYGISYPAITAEKLISAPIVLPPYDIQIEISSFLDKECRCLDSLIELHTTKIRSLNNLKKSMIYEYVTGKKEGE